MKIKKISETSINEKLWERYSEDVKDMKIVFHDDDIDTFVPYLSITSSTNKKFFIRLTDEKND